MADLSPPAPPRLRIFVSSPGDVDTERKIAERVIRRLQDAFAGRVALEPYFWENEPMFQHATFQNQIPATAEFDVVICILWSRLGTPLTASDGRRYPSGTDYEVETAREAHARTGRPDLMLYLNQTPAQIRQQPREERERMLRQLEALEDFVERHCLDRQTGIVKGAYAAYRDLGQFEDLLEKQLYRLIVSRLPTADGNGAVAQEGAGTWAGRPYQGLRAFDYEQTPIFFGRTRATGEVLALLRQRAMRLEEARAAAVGGLTGGIDPAEAIFVLVCAMSGVGKSSLVRAGVLPLLTQPGGGIGLWRRVVLKPGETPAGGDLFDALAQALTKENGLPELLAGANGVGELAFMLRQNPAGIEGMLKSALAQAAERARADEETRLRDEVRRCRETGRVHDVERLEARLAALRAPAARLAMVIDQIEELFILERVTPEERRKFCQALGALARNGWTWVIGTLRSDYFGRCATVPELMELKAGGLYDLQPPTPDELGQMIRRPAQAVGLGFERHPGTDAELDEALRDAAVRNPEALPLLEFALDQLYERRGADGRLTWAAYGDIGGLEGALASAAEAALAALRMWQQETFDHVMGGLVTLGTGAREEVAHRRTADYEALTAPAGARAFVDAFIAARLFVADQDTAGRAVVGVAHEALLARKISPAAGDSAARGAWQWARLGEWVEANADFLRVRARVAAGLKQWQDANRDAGFLLPAGRPLLDGEGLLRDHAAALSAEEGDYIARSVAAESERRRQRARTRASVMAGLGLLALGAGVGAWFGFRGERLAVAQTAEANKQAAIARDKTTEAEKQATLARDKTIEANKQTAIAEQEATKFQAQLRQASLVDVATAKDLAAEGHWREAIAYLGRAFTNDADNELARVWLWSELVYGKGDRMPRRILPVAAGINGISCSRDGRRVLAACGDGKVRQWDAGTFQPLGEPIDAGRLLANAVYSPDGKCIAVACAPAYGKDGAESAGYLQQYDADSGQSVGVRIPLADSVGRLVYSPDGKRLLTPSGGARQWDTTTGKPVGKPLGKDDTFYTSAIYSPDGKRIATVEEGSLQQWDANTGKTIGKDMNLEHPRASNIVYSSSGHRILSAFNIYKSNTGQIVQWDTSTSESLGKPIVLEDGVEFADYSPDGCKIIAFCGDGLTRQWSSELIRSGDAREVLLGLPLRSEGRVQTILYGPKGDRILSVSHAEGSPDCLVEWDAAIPQMMAEPVSGPTGTKEPEQARSVAGPDGKRFLILDDERAAGRMRLADATGEEIVPAFADEPGVWGACFSPDGKQVLAACADRTFRRWDATTGKALGEPTRCETEVRAIFLSGDGRRVALVCEVEGKPGFIEQRDAATGQKVGPALENNDKPGIVCYSADQARLLASYVRHQGETDSYYTLQWDPVAGQPVGEPIPGENPTVALAYSPDGRRFFLATPDSIQQYDGATRQRLGEPMKATLSRTVANAAYGPDGASILMSNGSDGSSRWEFDPPRVPPPAWLGRFVQVASGYRFGPGGDLVALSASERVALYAQVREEIEKAPADPDPRWQNLARWSLAPVAERRWTPGSGTTVRAVAESVQTGKDTVDAETINWMFPDLPLVHLALAAGKPDRPDREFLMRYDLDRLPLDDAALRASAAALLRKMSSSSEDEAAPQHREMAIQSARKAVALDPKMYRAWTILIGCLEDAHRPPDQLAACDGLLALPEATGNDFVNAGRLAGILGHGDQAREIFRRAEEKFPTDPRPHRFKGWVLIDLKAPAEALAEFQQCMQMLTPGEPPHNDVIIGLAVSHWATGDKAGAVNDYLPLLSGANAGYYASAEALKKDAFWTDAERQLLLAVQAETLHRHPKSIPKPPK